MEILPDRKHFPSIIQATSQTNSAQASHYGGSPPSQSQSVSHASSSSAPSTREPVFTGGDPSATPCGTVSAGYGRDETPPTTTTIHQLSVVQPRSWLRPLRTTTLCQATSQRTRRWRGDCADFRLARMLRSSLHRLCVRPWFARRPMSCRRWKCNGASRGNRACRVG
ncbi:uncharacterized protein MYCGRDRAFT_104997 [Zymoseptoria tritici IPO323]|uniref:Uncharacterized protein n=1 Tax=Zymoseptoria tritici (strain CBS 115943 / IPO323) TaxID=336722 RepID=F9XEA6_ZYMTI|nr:uncharacterized protein MYCGRDRAFT_104997 [Zymoseptoria tritici IPO323]EGP86618.1 hypothetical protein MYCGRDRAFT_104997 [Zymoseptoria tritici IPO323]